MDGDENTVTTGNENPNLTAVGGNAVTDNPPDYLVETAGAGGHEEMKEEQKDRTLVLEEGAHANDKPPGELLARLKEKNKQELLQDYSLLAPGSRIYLKWFKRFRKTVSAPYNTPWTELILVRECVVSEGTRKVWNFAHPYCVEIKGNVTLMPGEAWELMTKVATREEIRDRDERNMKEGHRLNKLEAPIMSAKHLDEDTIQPTTPRSATPQLDPYLSSHRELFESH